MIVYIYLTYFRRLFLILVVFICFGLYLFCYKIFVHALIAKSPCKESLPKSKIYFAFHQIEGIISLGHYWNRPRAIRVQNFVISYVFYSFYPSFVFSHPYFPKKTMNLSLNLYNGNTTRTTA